MANRIYGEAHVARLFRLLTEQAGARIHGGIPLPGRGNTWQRWMLLAQVAARDVSLVKLFEAHTDALAILAELGASAPQAGSRWAVWAAEPPDARVALHVDEHAECGVSLSGRKAWCSGAPLVTHALLTCWNAQGQACLAILALDAPGIAIDESAWRSPAMVAARTADLVFDGTPVRSLGEPGAYLDRPGFWHGGAGIAACWLGAVVPFVLALRAQVARRADPHDAVQLGAADVALRGAWAMLREAAAWVDAHPAGDAVHVVRRARLAAETAATQVMAYASRALGAGPLCHDAALATRFCDMQVFLRQSHGERDLAALGTGLAGQAQGRGADQGWAPWLPLGPDDMQDRQDDFLTHLFSHDSSHCIGN
ncbi:acyl-CoA/acyl-ACP dehydrogenase [Cupriavidus basilensis]|uniref:Acyl-CoA dehydrogenase n=1 Tax=Cupriavidus basilensis TaxID=68895 RepID=A0A643FYP8_9BURK|nr:acyl-CoA/acyl-ACP dehydrogenase [Cupriavidus basilensis]QOT81909.1 acyl-CoA dehydrogenase [Cupriavidus basilensis]